MRLGSDEYGDWLGVPSGEFIAAALADFKYTDPYVLLVPRDTWWTAMFNSPAAADRGLLRHHDAGSVDR